METTSDLYGTPIFDSHGMNTGSSIIGNSVFDSHGMNTGFKVYGDNLFDNHGLRTRFELPQCENFLKPLVIKEDFGFPTNKIPWEIPVIKEDFHITLPKLSCIEVQPLPSINQFTVREIKLFPEPICFPFEKKKFNMFDL